MFQTQGLWNLHFCALSLLPVSMQDHPPPPALLEELPASAGSPAVGCKVPYQLCRSDCKPLLSSLARLLPNRGCRRLWHDEHHLWWRKRMKKKEL